MRAMKDSGIEWIGEIPESWKLSRLLWCMEEIKEKNNPIQTTNVLSLTNKLGVIPYEEKGNQGNKAKEDYSEYGLAFENTLVINSMNVLIGSVGISKYYGCVSPVYYVFRNMPNSDLCYINYIFQTEQFQKELRKYANGILEIRLRISAHDMLRRLIPRPSLPEQQAISSYLDRQCALIDNITEKTKATIEEYKKLRQAIITQAVTKGVRGDRPMKDSGIEWIGEIPEEWDIAKIKVGVSKVGSGKTPSGGAETYASEGILFLRSQNIYDTGLNLNEPTFITEEIDEEMKSTRVQPNDVLLNITGGSIGRCCIFPPELKTANVNQHVSIIRVINTVFIPEYMHYYWNSTIGKLSIALYQTGGNREGMSADAIKNSPITITTIDEQKEIAAYLDKKCAEIDSIIAKKEQFLTELETYKKSMIYEYVTGKKEVPQA